MLTNGKYEWIYPEIVAIFDCPMKKNRKHIVLQNSQYITVKDWYRQNPNFFTHLNNIPTSEQIGTALQRQGYTRSETVTEVIYRK